MVGAVAGVARVLHQLRVHAAGVHVRDQHDDADGLEQGDRHRDEEDDENDPAPAVARVRVGARARVAAGERVGDARERMRDGAGGLIDVVEVRAVVVEGTSAVGERAVPTEDHDGPDRHHGTRTDDRDDDDEVAE